MKINLLILSLLSLSLFVSCASTVKTAGTSTDNEKWEKAQQEQATRFHYDRFVDRQI